MLLCRQNKLYRSVPSSPVSSLKGQLDTCPMARHQSSKLSPIKTILSKSSLPSLCGEGALGLRGKESPYQSFGSLSLSPNPIQWGGSTPTHILGRDRGNTCGDRWPTHGSPGRGGPESGGRTAVPSLHISPGHLVQYTCLHLFLSHSTKRGPGAT